MYMYRIRMEVIAKVIAKEEDEAKALAEVELERVRKNLRYDINHEEILGRVKLKRCYPPDCKAPLGKPEDQEHCPYYHSDYCSWARWINF